MRSQWFVFVLRREGSTLEGDCVGGLEKGEARYVSRDGFTGLE